MDQKDAAVRWVVADHLPGYPEAPEWERKVAVTDDGVAYVSAFLGADDADSIITDPGPVLWSTGKMYVKADWMIEQCPSAAACARALKRTALTYCGWSPNDDTNPMPELCYEVIRGGRKFVVAIKDLTPEESDAAIATIAAITARHGEIPFPVPCFDPGPA
jgi:hypothetical protein